MICGRIKRGAIDARLRRTGNSAAAASSGDNAGGFAFFCPARGREFLSACPRCSGSEAPSDACVRLCANCRRANRDRRCHRTRSARGAQNQAEESHSARLR
jgi:hypothetical protein